METKKLKLSPLEAKFIRYFTNIISPPNFGVPLMQGFRGMEYLLHHSFGHDLTIEEYTHMVNKFFINSGIVKKDDLRYWVSKREELYSQFNEAADFDNQFQSQIKN